MPSKSITLQNLPAGCVLTETLCVAPLLIGVENVYVPGVLIARSSLPLTWTTSGEDMLSFNATNTGIGFANVAETVQSLVTAAVV